MTTMIRNSVILAIALGTTAAQADTWPTCSGMSNRYYAVHLTAPSGGTGPTDAVAIIDLQAPNSGMANHAQQKPATTARGSHGIKHNVQVNIASLTAAPNYFELQYPTTGCTFTLLTSSGPSETWVISSPGPSSFQITSQSSSIVTPGMSGTAYALMP